MDKDKINRINALAKKSKLEGLTEKEQKEQKILREEYIKLFRNNLKATLNNIVIMDTKNNKVN